MSHFTGQYVNRAAFTYVVIAMIVIGGIVLGISTFKNHGKSPSAVIYCSPDGTLSSTQSIQSHRSYCIKSNIQSRNAEPNRSISYSFSIVDDEGNTVRDFKISHEKMLHLIVVRKDLDQFQHVHPEFDENSATFTVSDLMFPTPGDYRIFADFVPESAMMGPDGLPLSVTISEDVKIAGSHTPVALGEPAKTATTEGYIIARNADREPSATGMNMLSFTISKDGKTITDLQPYLGALGHAVVLKEGTLEYIHAHAVQESTAAQNGTIDFHVEFPFGGNYKVFLQFQHAGKVITADFVVPVRGEAAPASDPGTNHSTH